MKKTNKNMIKNIKILTIILLIVLVSMISLVGIYKQDKNQVNNTVKDYSYSMSLNGARNIKLIVSDKTKEVVKDKDGNVVESATDEEIEENGYTTEDVLINSKEDRTQDNFEKAKSIIGKRLDYLGVEEYNISVNKANGEMLIEIPEDSKTDEVAGKLTGLGKFEIIDTETKEVLLSNKHIKSSDVLYNTTTAGTTVYLEIAFNKEGSKILKDISNTYVEKEEKEKNEETGEETTKTVEKTITMKIDNEEIMTTHFDSELATGKIQMSVGKTSTDRTTLEGYISQAKAVAVSLDSGNLPLQYQMTKNQYILSDISEQDMLNVKIAIVLSVVVGIVTLILKYKENGILAGFSFLGLAAIYAIIIRYTNVVISIESIFGIVMILALNYLFVLKLLENIAKKLKEKSESPVKKAIVETYKKFFNIMLPLFILSIAFCFVKWVPTSSFGMITFWGLSIIAIYNVIITKNLMKIKVEDK